MMLGPVIVDVAGLTLTAEDEQLLGNPWVGGIILFARNFQSIAQLENLVAEIRAVRPELVICVDQEGGRVQRFRDGFTIIPPMADIGAVYAREEKQGLLLAHACGWLMAAELRACGIDLSFAPVLDLDDNRCAVIANRSFSIDARIASILSEAFVDGMHDANMCATGKHFPGHGAVTGDSHFETPVDARALEAILADDVMPYRHLSEQGKLDAVMPAHVVYSAVDKHPAGFSSYWLQDILKKQLRFDGVIFSDDLTMEGAGVIADMGERARVALAAGCTALLVCNQRPAQQAVVGALEQSGLAPASNLQRLKRPFARAGLPALRTSQQWRRAHEILKKSLAL
ncbi:MAG TPA: beta-N-acetylhexosaminidase [Pseudomonadales bacterium]|nr:beta-N-acetylhexosaminidase [Pseudomonadales bacterium]